MEDLGIQQLLKCFVPPDSPVLLFFWLSQCLVPGQLWVIQFSQHWCRHCKTSPGGLKKPSYAGFCNNTAWEKSSLLPKQES